LEFSRQRRSCHGPRLKSFARVSRAGARLQLVRVRRSRQRFGSRGRGDFSTRERLRTRTRGRALIPSSRTAIGQWTTASGPVNDRRRWVLAGIGDPARSTTMILSF
jgi:hypothetical protein